MGRFVIEGDYVYNPSLVGNYECMSRLLASVAYLVTWVADVEGQRFAYEFGDIDRLNLDIRDKPAYQCVRIYVGMCNLFGYHGLDEPLCIDVDSECGFTFANARAFLVDFARLVSGYLDAAEEVDSLSSVPFDRISKSFERARYSLARLLAGEVSSEVFAVLCEKRVEESL